MALGVMITYLVLDFPDLTVDGSFPLGAVVSARLILTGANPLLALAASALAGAAAGLLTGLIHVKMRVRALFSGIIMMTALYSINLRLAGDISPLAPRQSLTLFRNNPVAAALPPGISTLLIALMMVLIIKCLLDLFFKTRAGFLLRAAGDNPQMVTALARDKGQVKILGLMIANALVALSGSLVAQEQRLFEISMGTGSVVLSLASVILGVNLLRRLEQGALDAALVYHPLYWQGVQVELLMEEKLVQVRNPHQPGPYVFVDWGGALPQRRAKAC